jgi:rod shape-determining protein MreB
VFSSFRRMFSSDLAIDLGTANTVIYASGRGVVCSEPSVVAVESVEGGKRRVVAVGNEAKGMIGRTPEKIVALRPLRGGVIADFELTGELLRHLVAKTGQRGRFFRPRVVICVPHGVSEVERRAVRESAEAAGAGEVFLIEESMGAAIGAGLPVSEPSGSLLLDIGGGTSEVAIISLRGIVYSHTIRVGGDKMDEAIVNHVRRTHNILIGERTAEQIKIAVGSALPTGEELAIEVTGRDVVQGAPQTAVITEEEIREVLLEPLWQIIGMVRGALERIPPELASDVVERGIMVTGGGALLRRVDEFLAVHVQLPVTVAADPISVVAIGAGTVLDNMENLREMAS